MESLSATRFHDGNMGLFNITHKFRHNATTYPFSQRRRRSFTDVSYSVPASAVQPCPTLGLATFLSSTMTTTGHLDLFWLMVTFIRKWRAIGSANRANLWQFASNLHGKFREMTKEAMTSPNRRGAAHLPIQQHGGLGIAVSRMDATPAANWKNGHRGNYWLLLH